jgi:hypothetical protein
VINVNSFERLAKPLTEAAEELTVSIAGALKDLYLNLSEDPDRINSYRRAYEAKVIKAVKKWQKARQEWVKDYMPLAYQLGLKHGQAEISALRKLGVEIPEPTENVNDTVPFIRLGGSAAPF